MHLLLTPEQQQFRDQVRAFIASDLPDEIRNYLRMGHPPRKSDVVTWQRALHSKGWAVPHWPREYGGSQMSDIEKLILQDELFRANAPQPLHFNCTMLGPVLIEFGTPEQKSHWLPKLANLDVWFCQGFSEPGSGSDLASLRTAAVRQGDDYIVNGQKIWTTAAHLADWIFALVRTGGGSKKQEGISFLLINLRTPGITIRPIIGIDGGHHLNEVFFDNVRVPVGNRVGVEGEGWRCAKFLLGNERTGITAVGFSRERLRHARRLAERIEQGGRPMIEDRRLREDIAALEAETRALEITQWRFFASSAAGEDRSGAYASMLKLKGVELQQDIAALLARIAGPQSLEWRSYEGAAPDDWTASTANRYHFLRAASIYGGSSEVQKEILAKALLG